jgi:hypothetical protein
MAPCEVCKLNKEGKTYWMGCPYRDEENPVGCRQCIHICGKAAILIAGKNICAQHSYLMAKRILNKEV